MKKTVDLRGLVCPEPVLRAKKLLDDAGVDHLEALVESEVNVNNLQRLARSLKIAFSSKGEDDFFRVELQKQPTSHLVTEPSINSAVVSQVAKRNGTSTEVGTVVFLAKDRLGDGDPEFSNKLIDMFLQTLLQAGHRPRAILMANTGVKLMAPDSPTKQVLDDFRDAGVEVLVCGLCVEFYGLKEKIPLEQITNMFAVCEFLMVADKVIQP